MIKYLVFVVLVCFLWCGTLADSNDALYRKCEEYDIPEPPCCGTLDVMTTGDFKLKHPFAIANYYFSRNGPGLIGCIGAIINTRWVLTAAHCANGHRNAALVPYVNKQYIIADETVHFHSDVDRMVTHPLYIDGLGNTYDVSLLHLSNPINYTKFIQPICLPIDPELRKSNFVKTNFTAIGYRGFKSVQIGSLKPLMFYVYNPGTTSGDSGTPMAIQLNDNPNKLLANYVLGTLHGGAGLHSFWIKTTSVIEWIMGTIKKYSKKETS